MGKGGGGGDGGAAEREAARRGRVNASINAINGLFFDNGTKSLTSDRQASLDDVQSKVENKFLPELQEDTLDAGRELKFALARRGLLGGSAQSDAKQRLNDRVSDTERDISSRALVARNAAESSQQSLLDNLIAQAQGDTNQGILLNQATVGQNAAINNAVDSANSQQLPNVFQDVGTLFKQIVDQQNVSNGIRQGLQSDPNSSTSINLFGSGKTNSGNITRAS